ncbi:hypothetical protein ACIBSW_24180 [Actinoplanes sp. NPDC049668]|uniref:hypothetical protein n=1 Tax=unclassified Actinoplanes TaxID=2626549 RepID=UPI0033BF5383
MSTPIVPASEPGTDMPTEPAPPARRDRRWILIGGVLAVVLVAAGGWFAYDRLIKQDPGVAACNVMREHADAVQGGAGAPMTGAEYAAARAQFEESRHDDIREHGTSLIDVVSQIQKLGKDPGAGAVVYLGPLTAHTTGLQTACANHGVKLDLNLAGAPAGKAAAATACAEVFQPGKVVDEGKAQAGCAGPGGQVRYVSAFECTDGRRLYQVDATTGASAGYGFGGKSYVASADSAKDAKYGQAYRSCIG